MIVWPGLVAALFLLNCGILSTSRKIYLRWCIVVNNRFPLIICPQQGEHLDVWSVAGRGGMAA